MYMLYICICWYIKHGLAIVCDKADALKKELEEAGHGEDLLEKIEWLTGNVTACNKASRHEKGEAAQKKVNYSHSDHIQKLD